MLKTTQNQMKELRQVANEYVDESLRKTEEAVAQSLSEIRDCRSKFRAAIAPQQQQSARASSPIIEDV